MITLLDPPEDDEVLYNVLYAQPNPSSLPPLQNMVATSSDVLLSEAVVEDACQTTRMPSSHGSEHHLALEEISTDDETDDEEYMSTNSDHDSDTVDSLRRELMAIEDSWGRHGLEHMIHIHDDERVDGIPTFTMPVNLDMSWDESDFLEEMAEDMKLLDNVASRVLQHEDEVAYDGVDSYIRRLEMIETSLRHELMSIEYIWRRNGIDLCPEIDTGHSHKSSELSGALLKSVINLEIDGVDTFTESEESSQHDALDESSVSDLEYIMPIEDATPFDGDSSGDCIVLSVDRCGVACQTDPCHQDVPEVTDAALEIYEKLTTDLVKSIVALQEELHQSHLQLNGLKTQLTSYPPGQVAINAEVLDSHGMTLVRRLILTGTISFGALIVLSTLHRRPMGSGNFLRE